MKTNYKTILAIALSTALLMLNNGCTNLTNGLSTDPVNVTDPSVIDESKYMSGAQVILIGIFEGDQARQTGMWAGYFDGEDRQYAGIQNYVTSGQDFDVEWVNIYTNLFKNTQLLKQNARPQKNLVAVGIAQVMEAMSIGLAADIWGDVPYSQITQYPKITEPVFDKQATVYASAQSLLDSAIANLGSTGKAPGDFLLGGNAAAWTAVAHTIKARLYLHTRNYTRAITEAMSGIANPAGNLMATHGSAYLQTFNLFYSFLTYDRSGYMAANCFATKLLDPTQANNRNNSKTLETGRLNYIYWYDGSAGLNFGKGNTWEPNVQVDFDWGNPPNQNGFFGATTSFPIATWEETTLILAESYMKQATADPASALAQLNLLRAYYNTRAHVNSGYATTPMRGKINASTSSISVVGDTATRFTTQLKVKDQLLTDQGALIGTIASITDDQNLTLTANSGNDVTASNFSLNNSIYAPYVYADFAPGGIDNNGTDAQDKALLREILEERYVTLIGQIEGWTDMRRTWNFLNIPLPAGKTDYPRRGIYSQIEQNTNTNCADLIKQGKVGLFDPVDAFSTAY